MNSLCHKPDFITELKNDLEVVCNRMSAEKIHDEQLCWENDETRKLPIHFSKEKAKNKARAKILT